MTRRIGEPETRVGLGSYLASIRTDRGLSQREVERLTDKVVSNAYLSQIETDQIKKPNPNILHKLSEVYGISYEDLMERAGFVAPTRTQVGSGERHGRVATFAEHNLSSEEEAELIKYLGYLRSKK